VCRNVLIYFEREHAVEIIERLATFCQPGGYLLLGAVERPLFWMSRVATMEQAGELVQLTPDRLRPFETPRAIPIQMFDVESSGRTVGASSNPERPATGQERLAPSARPRAVGSGRAAQRTTRKRRATRPDPSIDIGSILRAAETAENEGRVDGALVLVDDAIAMAPLVAAAHLQRGLILKRSGKLAQAVEPLRAARFLEPRAWLAPYQLALCLEAMGDTEEALEAYRHTLGMIEEHHPSGLYHTDIEVENLASTVAEVCRKRIPDSEG
ncbi:MAG: CheR family methyltransferase, partial [Myxococcota bacterium]